jgi:23S rRNA pseudouridine1911/1915/1917 synthase
MEHQQFQNLILYEDNHLLIVNKPNALLSQPDHTGEPDIFHLCKAYLKERYQKPGEAYLGLIHRLDRSVSGITIFAKTSKAAARLAEQFRTRAVTKIYRAIVEGSPAPEEGRLIDLLFKEERTKTARRARAGETGQRAELSYRTLGSSRIKDGVVSIVEIELYTGRFHQIRFQMASIGHPIYGDRKYGAHHTSRFGIALHAYRIAIIHPVRKSPLEIICEPPEWWPISTPAD